MKPFLNWRSDWLVGFDELDQQHISLAGVLNQMFNLLGEDATGADPRLYRLLQELAESTRCHFSDEEALMRACGYPELPEHHREHLMLLAELRELMRDMEEGRRHFTLQTLTALKHWQIDHVLNSDKQFAGFVRRHAATLKDRPVSVRGATAWARSKPSTTAP